VPKFRYVAKDEFEENWHLATWVPNDPEGPTVLMNNEAPLLLEAIKHHQMQYPEVYAVEVEKIVKDTYGEVAVCKIAHSQKLTACGQKIGTAEEPVVGTTSQAYRSAGVGTTASKASPAASSISRSQWGQSSGLKPWACDHAAS